MKTTKKSEYTVFAIIWLTLLVALCNPVSMHTKSGNGQAKNATVSYKADDAATLLKQLNSEKTDFFGSSVESIIELGFAIRHPKFIKSWL